MSIDKIFKFISTDKVEIKRHAKNRSINRDKSHYSLIQLSNKVENLK